VILDLIRHGLSEAGAKGQYEGSLDTPLCEAGRQALCPSNDKHNMVYITGKRRTAETAEILFPGAETRVVPGLREMNFGTFEGRSWREMENDPDYRAWVDGGCWASCPGGEDRASFSRRVCEAFVALVSEALAEGRDRLVIVAHGGTQMAVMERWCEPKGEYYSWCTKPGQGWRLDASAWPERLRVVERLDFTEAAK